MHISLSLPQVTGTVQIPPSKSMSQRYCAAALLHNGTTQIRNIGQSADEQAAISIIQALGAQLTQSTGSIEVHADGMIKGNTRIHCAESGLAARLFTPIAALANTPITVDGQGSLLQRPMHFFTATLTALGVSLPDFNGHLPFTICGPLQAKNLSVDGQLSSQFISGLLFALSAAATDNILLEVKDVVSKPYIDLSLDVLNRFGHQVQHTNYAQFYIEPNRQRQARHIDIIVEGDWSSAAFWLAAATINGSLSLAGLQKESLQADARMLDLIQAIGAKVNWADELLQVESNTLRAFDIDITDAPDLFPVLSVLAASCVGCSSLKGIHRLLYKESNRAESIAALLTQLEVIFDIIDDTLIIHGKDSFPAITYYCPNDHRMAMAAALAAMRTEAEMHLFQIECVRKSYPNFWEDIADQVK